MLFITSSPNLLFFIYYTVLPYYYYPFSCDLRRTKNNMYMYMSVIISNLITSSFIINCCSIIIMLLCSICGGVRCCDTTLRYTKRRQPTSLRVQAPLTRKQYYTYGGLKLPTQKLNFTIKNEYVQLLPRAAPPKGICVARHRLCDWRRDSLLSKQKESNEIKPAFSKRSE